MKLTGKPNVRNLHVGFDVAGAGNVTFWCARQFSTLPVRGVPGNRHSYRDPLIFWLYKEYFLKYESKRHWSVLLGAEKAVLSIRLQGKWCGQAWLMGIFWSKY